MFLTHPGDTYPDLVAHCDYCSWWAECEARRRRDDHLCYVAGISRTQIKTLRALGVDTLSGLAALDSVPEPPQGSREALARAREQARVQQIGRETDRPYHKLRAPLDAEHGLALLPEPTPDDIFLDFEGDHFAEDGVREYLLGYVTRGPDGKPVYTSLWATRHALRHRPDHIVVGEVRGGEAADLLQALNTGHGGSLTTVHAESALSRLASCAMQGGGDLPWDVTCRGVVEDLVNVTREHGEDGHLARRPAAAAAAPRSGTPRRP